MKNSICNINKIHMAKAFMALTALLLAFMAAAASPDIPAFGNLTMANGLSHYSVMATYQDERGLLWIGTRRGIDIYDGTNVTNYQRIPGDNTTPISDYVRAITGDRNGHVFVLTIRGIIIYDIAADKFTNVSVKHPTAMAYGNGTLYFASGKKVYTFTPDGKAVPTSISADSEIGVLHCNDSLLYIGTVDNGLKCVNLKSGSKTSLMDSGNITCVFSDNNGDIWAGTQTRGLHLIRRNGQRINFIHKAGDSGSISSNFIRTICRDSRGRLWAGTLGGLSRFDEEYGTFTNYLAASEPPFSSSAERLSHSSVWSLTCDRQGTIWIGTYFNGLLSYNPKNDIFHTFKAAAAPGKALSYPVAGEIAEDKDGTIWIATEGGGINRLNPSTGNIDWHIDSENRNNNIKALKFDAHRKCLWAGTHLGGLKKYDIATGKYSVYPLGNDKANIICDIEIYDRETLLIATHDGIYRFDIADESFSPLFRSGKEGYAISLALDLALDHARTLWIGGAEGGLYNYNFVTNKMKKYSHTDKDATSLGSDNINCIYISPSNTLWIGTSDAGLDKFDREREQFIHYSPANGKLPSDCVYGIQQLPDGKMLLLTDKSLVLSNGDATTSYGIHNAVPLNAFNNKAIHLSADGKRVYAGGIDGMVVFDPDDLHPHSTIYSIFPTRLMVDGHEITTGDETGALAKSISVAKDITLPGTHDYITLYYAITDLTHDNNLNPRYRLEGYSKDWIPLGADNAVSFTNLAPGNYRLHVKASDEPGAPESVLQIKITPPVYFHSYLIVAYILAAIGLGWWSISTYRRRIAMKQAMAIEREKNRQIEELNQDKVRFFINISNEFRTPLALIIGKIESLLRSPQLPHSLLNKVNGAYTNCVLMRDMMAELLDFRRYERGAMKIKVGEHNVVKFLSDIYALFRDYAADKGIRFRFNRSNESIMLWYDQAQLRKVVNNLLSNAFKHTKSDGEVTLSVRKGDGVVVIEVSDTGCGISSKDIDKIFNRFYQGSIGSEGDWQGIGVGLALSKGIVELHHGKIEVFSTPGESSTFTVTIPSGRSHFSDEEIAETGDYRQALEYNEQHIRPAITQNAGPAESSDRGSEPEDIMVIAEGNGQLREMLTDIFRPYFRILATSDGEEAMLLIDENKPRLIVSGYNLPGISGVKLCRKIKSQSSTSDTPYVFVSSHNADQEILEALNAGADDYLTLPFDVRQLLARCRNLITKQNNRNNNQAARTSDSDKDSMIVSNGADIEFMQRATKIVEDNIADSDFNINRFAAAMNVSRTSLFMRIKSISGQTPNDFINRIKLKHAARMLCEQQEANIADVAYAFGFSSPRYFSRCFKEYFHQSPRSYRASHI